MREALQTYVKHVGEPAGHVRGNQPATKPSLVGPLFTTLGEDPTDPLECIPECRGDFGPNRSIEPIDWGVLKFVLGRGRQDLLHPIQRPGQSVIAGLELGPKFRDVLSQLPRVLLQLGDGGLETPEAIDTGAHQDQDRDRGSGDDPADPLQPVEAGVDLGHLDPKVADLGRQSIDGRGETTVRRGLPRRGR